MEEVVRWWSCSDVGGGAVVEGVAAVVGFSNVVQRWWRGYKGGGATVLVEVEVEVVVLRCWCYGDGGVCGGW
ncbi:hypothetical protein Hanom_Chr11g01038821 [Helianthus anomalus]